MACPPAPSRPRPSHSPRSGKRPEMSLHAQLQKRASEGKPIRVALIGAGKFGSMYLAQVPRTPGIHLAGIADLWPDAARANLARVGWKAERTQAASVDEAIRTGATYVGSDWQ